jgi:hypothetical protein
MIFAYKFYIPAAGVGGSLLLSSPCWGKLLVRQPFAVNLSKAAGSFPLVVTECIRGYFIDSKRG